MIFKGGNQPSRRGEVLDAQTAVVLAQEFRDALEETLKSWFPRCVDEKYGGFLCDFNYKWKPSGPQPKMLEYQARMVRLIARAAAQPGFESYREFARHGFEYLANAMWDQEYGGWYRMLDRAGIPQEASTKHGHGSSYAIAACAAYYELTSDPRALELAKQGFLWLDRVGHDAERGGYFALYTREGACILSQEQCPIPDLVRDCIGTPLGLKDANTNADMLETVADLSRVWVDATVEERLVEMLQIVRDRMIVPPGAVHMYYQPDWTPVPDFARYAYGLNTSNILAKALRSPGLERDAKGLEVVKSAVDTAMSYGWDQSNGGFYYGGSTFGPTYVEDIVVLIQNKYWWPQAEGLRALLRMAILCPHDEMDYLGRLRQLWSYIKKHVIDWDRGGWLWVATDSKPRVRRAPKATAWKEPSHEVHSLLECIRLLDTRES
jgi:mannose/cellobiose epimerase-like protein (N-acyl-D-glucosamine 2-epimerase family)